MRLALLGAVALAFGCAPVLSTFVPADTTPKNTFRGSYANGLSYPEGPIDDVMTRARTLSTKAAGGQPLTDEETSELVESVVGLTLNPPTPAIEIQGRWGFGERWDMGLRFAGRATRLDARYQFLDFERHQVNASVGLGLSLFRFALDLGERVEQVVDVDDYGRIEIDVPLLVGWRWRWGQTWLGPKAVLTAYSASMKLKLEGGDRTAEVSGGSAYWGGQLGFAVGWKSAWLAFEMTVADLSGSAEIDSGGRKSDAEFDGLILYPVLGVLVQLP